MLNKQESVRSYIRDPGSLAVPVSTTFTSRGRWVSREPGMISFRSGRTYLMIPKHIGKTCSGATSGRNKRSVKRPTTQLQLQQSRHFGIWGTRNFPWGSIFLQEWLATYRSKTSGLFALKELGGEGHYATQKSCLDYIKSVEAGATKYHSMAAAELASKAIAVAEVNEDTQKHVGTMADIMRTTGYRHSCFSKHPGACSSLCQQVITATDKMVRSLPREPCVLRFELARSRSKKVVYVRLTIGKAYQNNKRWFGFPNSRTFWMVILIQVEVHTTRLVLTIYICRFAKIKNQGL